MEFSKLINAVKLGERTDRYKTLAALYCLGAADAPVTARAVDDLLKLHLGKKAPANVSDSLRRNSAYISVAAKGPPLLWTLLEEGVTFLRDKSGLDLPLKSTKQSYHTDIAIICALESPEFEAVVQASGGPNAWTEISDPSFPHNYRETTLTTADGTRLRVVGVTSTSMGLTAAAIATTQLIMRFRPRIVAMVGIAAGTHDGKKNFGDILVADPSVDYASGKVAFSRGVREFLPDPYPIGLNARLRSVLQKYRGGHQLLQQIKSRWNKSAPKGGVRLHLGPLGAADQVIDDASRVLEIQKNWRKLIGVEMETYGVYRACHESPEPKPRFVSFKSVCDFAAEKGDSWQPYAAFTAAEFAFRFFETEWASLWPTRN